MRGVFEDEDDDLNEGGDFFANGFQHDCPYMFMINALGVKNTAVSVMVQVIGQELTVFIQALKAAKNSKAINQEITNSCARIFDLFHKACIKDPSCFALSPVNFSLAILLPCPRETKKLIAFGLGKSMVVLARKGDFLTLKPAVLLNDGQVRALPCSGENQSQKRLDAQKEVYSHRVMMDLKPEDEVCLLSPSCYQLLGQEEKRLASQERIISLRVKQELLEFKDSRRFFIQKFRAIYKIPSEEAQIENFPLIIELKNEIFLLEKELEEVRKKLMANPAWKRNDLRLKIALEVGNKIASKEESELRERIREHNSLYVTCEDESQFRELQMLEQSCKKQLSFKEQSLKEASPNFTHVTMHIPENDFVLFRSRLDIREHKIKAVFKRECQQRFPSTTLMPESHKCLSRNYQDLFNIRFNYSILYRYLLLLALCDGDENFDEDLKLYHLTYDLDNFPEAKREAINASILFLKRACKAENLNHAEIVEKLGELFGLQVPLTPSLYI